MVLESRFSVETPHCSIQDWIFGSCHGPLSDRKVWIDADNPATRYLTLSSARLLAKRLAVGLRKHGLQPGDRVLVFAGNSVVFPALMLGIWMAGGIFTGANPGYVTRELAYQLRDSGAKVMIASMSNWKVATRAAEMAGMERSDVFAFDGAIPGLSDEDDAAPVNAQHWRSLVASRHEGHAFDWYEPSNPRETTCTLNYSSGTTGLPKGVEITHYNHVSNGQAIALLNQLHPEYVERTRQGAALCILPMYHAFSQGYFITSYPHEGIPVFVMPQFELGKMLRHIAEFKITKLFAVPPILVLLSKHPLVRSADLSSLDMVGCGAAPLAGETQREVNRLLPEGCTGMPKQGWGMTELTCTAMSWDPTSLVQEGVGELLPNCKARLVSMQTGQEILEAGVPGELYVAAPTLMRGYWRNAEATLHAITSDPTGTRWLRTGDIAYVTSYDPGAIFHVVDRVKELIKVRGFQVSPSELDALLLEREDIADVAVVGVMKNGEEVPRAYVVCKQGRAGASEREIEAWVAERAAPYKQLRGGVVFIDAIPKNPAGKILRKVLSERAKREVEAIRARL